MGVFDVNGVQEVVDNVAQEVPFLGQRPFGLHALHGVADGTLQDPGIDLPFDEIILRPLLDGLQREGLVVEPAQDNHRGALGTRGNLVEGINPAAVGQRKVQQNEMEAAFRPAIFLKSLQSFGKAAGHGGFKPPAARFQEELLDQPRVSRVVLHKQHPDVRLRRYWLAPLHGSNFL